MSKETKESSSRKRAKNAAILELNVGGTVFSTTRDTLLSHPSPFFKRLLAEEGDDDYTLTGSLLDDNGRIFIDREPQLFAQVLKYLRFSFDPKHLTDQEREELKNEALYYQLDGLINLLGPPCRCYDELALSNQDQNIRQEAQHVRRMLLQNTGANEANDLLIDLFPAEGPRLNALFEEPPTSPGAAILFDKHVETAREKTELSLPNSVQDFKERLIRFGGPLLADFPMEHLVIAGGSVLQCLLKDQQEADTKSNSDIDMFVVADSEEAAKATVDRILQHLSRRDNATQIRHHKLLVTRSPFAITFCVGIPQRNIQLILVRHQCAADVILNFDIDCCQVLWDGQRVLATPSAFRALQTGINIADPERRGSNDYEFRLAKYAARGFLVAVPGLDVSRVKTEYIRNSCFGYHQGNLKIIHLTFTNGKDRPDHHLGDRAIDGLSKLIALSTIYDYASSLEGVEIERPNRRLQGGEDRWPGAFVGSLGTGNYLLDYAKLAERYEGTWTLRTPPYPPPTNIQTSIFRAKNIDTVGVELIPWDVPPNVAFKRLSGQREQFNFFATAISDDLDQKRLVCFDLLRDVRLSTACPHVLDARRQYPFYPFVDGRGRLKRYLEFAPSSDMNGNPWVLLNEEEWTIDVYDK